MYNIPEMTWVPITSTLRSIFGIYSSINYSRSPGCIIASLWFPFPFVAYVQENP